VTNTGQISSAALLRIAQLKNETIDHVVGRLYALHGPVYERFGEAGRSACREDIAFHFDFLEPALEFGDVAPLAAYLGWLNSVLEARDIPAEQVSASLTLVGEYLGTHLDPADADTLRATIAAANDRVRLRPAETLPNYPYQGDASPTCDALAQALVNGDHKQVRTMIDTAVQGAIKAGSGLPEVAVHLVQPALYDIGYGWQQNRISVAQEHMATAGAHTALAQGYLLQEPRPPNGKRILLACLEGNHHALGLRMISDAFALAGWDTRFLGGDTPVKSVIQQIRDLAPHIIGLSATLPAHLRTIKTGINTIRAALGPSCPPIMVGGLVINQISGIAEALGADFTCRDATTVVETAESRVQSHAGH